MLSSNGRRSKIRAPKRNLANEVDFEQSWAVLSVAIKEIQNKNASKLSFEELYRKSYNLVLRKHGKQLYDSVNRTVGIHLLEVKNQLIKRVESDSDRRALLKEVSAHWADHLLSMRMISDVLMYLDRVYAKENHLPLVYDVGINLFRDNIVKYDNLRIGNTLNRYLVEEITDNRNGLIVDIFLVKDVIAMMVSLLEDEKNLESGENFYLKYFEPYYLDMTVDYYEKIGNELLESNHGTTYIKKVDELLKNEQDKCVLYVPQATYEKLISLIDKVLISSKIDRVMKFAVEGLRYWLLENKHNELELLYKLLARVNYFAGFNSQLREIILEEGAFIEQQQQQPLTVAVPTKGGKSKGQSAGKKASAMAISWIEKVMELKDKYDRILKSLGNDAGVQRTIDNAFMELLNKNVKLSEFLSLFIDELIKKSGDKSEEEVETIVTKSIAIFRFIKDKDVFEKYYKNHLAKRLLKSSSDLERTFISRLKNEIGASFTSKLEGMFRDINLSKDVSKKFNHKNFEINVLTRTFWPIQPPSNNQEVILAPHFEEMQRSFADYYLSLHSGRNLSWAYNFGSVDIRIKFEKKIHELNMSLYCGLITLLFEEHDELTFQQIEMLTKIPKADLIRSLQSIAVAPRTRILTKKPMSKEINQDDTFSFNYLFTSPMTKVKVLTVANKIETDAERTKTIEKVDEDRKFELDAAIVRIMKTRKTMTHNELISETVRQITRFNPSPQFIKKRIDALLEREYLQRDEEQRSIYHYLA